MSIFKLTTRCNSPKSYSLSRQILFINTALLATGCSDYARFEYHKLGTPTYGPQTPEAEERGRRALKTLEDPPSIDALIELLAISQETASEHPVFSPSVDAKDTDPRVIAYQAADKLSAIGRRAFPFLLDHFDDRRQSVAFRAIIPHTVGLSCFLIIESQIFNLPKEYQRGYHRHGADGKLHTRPYYLEIRLFDMNSVKSWLAERSDKSIREIQIEALTWLIEEEKKIGFADDEEKKRFLVPLENQILKIKQIRY